MRADRTGRAAWGITAACVGYFALVLTNGTFDFSGREYLDRVFSEMLLNLRRGDLAIDPAVIGKEAMVRDGRTYTYFGFLPALLRGVAAPFVDLRTAAVARGSTWIGLALMAACLTGGWMAALGPVRDATFARRAVAPLVVATLLGGPALLLAANASVYHEAIVWGGAAAAAFLWLLVRAAAAGRRPGLAASSAMALLAGAALHARPNVAVGLYLTLAVLFVLEGLAACRERRGLRARIGALTARLALPMALAGVGAGLFLLVNALRWGDALAAAHYQGHVDMSAERHALVARYGTFNLSRVPAAIAYYFVGAPAVTDAVRRASGTGFDWIEGPEASLVLMQPLLAALAPFGAVRLWRRVRHANAGTGVLLAGIAGMGASALLTLSYQALALRYRADLLPFVHLLAIAGYWAACERLADATRGQRVALALAWAGIAVGLAATHVALFMYKFSWHAVEQPWGLYWWVMGRG